MLETYVLLDFHPPMEVGVLANVVLTVMHAFIHGVDRGLVILLLRRDDGLFGA